MSWSGSQVTGSGISVSSNEIVITRLGVWSFAYSILLEYAAGSVVREPWAKMTCDGTYNTAGSGERAYSQSQLTEQSGRSVIISLNGSADIWIGANPTTQHLTVCAVGADGPAENDQGQVEMSADWVGSF